MTSSIIRSHGTISISMGPGSLLFSLWKYSELPAEWRRDPSRSQLALAARNMDIPEAELECYTAVELPDVGWGRQYYSWAVAELQIVDVESGFLPVMLVAQEDYRGLADSAERRRVMQELLDALLRTGKPPGHFTKAYGRRNR